MSDTNNKQIFKRVNSTSYILDEQKSNSIYTECREYLLGNHNFNGISTSIINETLKEMICYHVGVLVSNNLLDELITTGFIAISFNSDIDFSVSVGWINDELVYGILVK